MMRTASLKASITLQTLLVVAVVMACACGASAQVYRVRPEVVRPHPQLITAGTLSISATPGTVNFVLVSKGAATGSSGVTIATTWNVIGVLPTLNVYGYFSSATAALTDGKVPANLIPSSAVLGQMTTGVPTSYTAFTQTVPAGGASAGLMLVNVSGLLTLGGSRTDVLNLKIDLSSLPKLPAGSYSGTLTLQASMN
jgi:hypothetical protein